MHVQVYRLRCTQLGLEAIIKILSVTERREKGVSTIKHEGVQQVMKLLKEKI